MILELELLQLLAPSLSSNCSTLKDVQFTCSNTGIHDPFQELNPDSLLPWSPREACRRTIEGTHLNNMLPPWRASYQFKVFSRVTKAARTIWHGFGKCTHDQRSVLICMY